MFIRQIPANPQSMKLRQVASGAVYHDSSVNQEWSFVHKAKLDALLDLLEEIGKPSIVVYEFEHEAQRIEEALHEDDCTRLSGTPKRRAMIIDHWNRGEIPVLLLQSSQAHGINLQAGGHHMIRFGPTWNLEHHAQMIDRLHRMGQTKPVFVHTLVAEHTVDEIVVKAIAGKARTQQELLDYLKKSRR